MEQLTIDKLIEENKLLKEMLYYKDINPMETP